MSDSKKTNVTVQFPVLFFLFLTFMVLKLTEVIDWSWWWITAPLWIPVAVVLAILIIAVGCVLVAAPFAARRRRRLRREMAMRFRRSDERVPKKWRAKHLPEADAVRQAIQLQLCLNPELDRGGDDPLGYPGDAVARFD